MFKKEEKIGRKEKGKKGKEKTRRGGGDWRENRRLGEKRIEISYTGMLNMIIIYI